MTTNTTGRLRFLGLCGADDSIHPNLLGIISHAYPFVEFGVLIRPDKEGTTPRYASPEYLQQLAAVAKCPGRTTTMRLAAHLCGSRVDEVLKGDNAFVSTLAGLGFQRVQINATAVNGVDTSRLAESVPFVKKIMVKHTELEFILQKNDETQPLWQGLLDSSGGRLPANVSMLVDESKGTGGLASSWPSPDGSFRIGYAGGIGPNNIAAVLKDTVRAAAGKEFWIDMESSLRSTKNGQDVFDLDKCYQVIHAVVGMAELEHSHPGYLPS